jgi:hypothetical protein
MKDAKPTAKISTRNTFTFTATDLEKSKLDKNEGWAPIVSTLAAVLALDGITVNISDDNTPGFDANVSLKSGAVEVCVELKAWSRARRNTTITVMLHEHFINLVHTDEVMIAPESPVNNKRRRCPAEDFGRLTKLFLGAPIVANKSEYYTSIESHRNAVVCCN